MSRKWYQISVFFPAIRATMILVSYRKRRGIAIAIWLNGSGEGVNTPDTINIKTIAYLRYFDINVCFIIPILASTKDTSGSSNINPKAIVNFNIKPMKLLMSIIVLTSGKK